MSPVEPRPFGALLVLVEVDLPLLLRHGLADAGPQTENEAKGKIYCACRAHVEQFSAVYACRPVGACPTAQALWRAFSLREEISACLLTSAHAWVQRHRDASELSKMGWCWPSLTSALRRMVVKLGAMAMAREWWVGKVDQAALWAVDGQRCATRGP